MQDYRRKINKYTKVIIKQWRLRGGAVIGPRQSVEGHHTVVINSTTFLEINLFFISLILDLPPLTQIVLQLQQIDIARWTHECSISHSF